MAPNAKLKNFGLYGERFFFLLSSFFTDLATFSLGSPLCGRCRSDGARVGALYVLPRGASMST